MKLREGIQKIHMITALLVLICILGCGSRKTPSFYINEKIDFSFIKRVAVLPLDNLTGDKFAADAVRQVVISELLASGLVEVVCPGDVTAALDALKVRKDESLSAEHIKALGKKMNVQAVVMGAVNKYGEVRVGNISAPEVTVTLMMADTGTGSIIWSVTKTEGGASFWAKHFGTSVPTMSQTVLKVVREAIQTLYQY